MNLIVTFVMLSGLHNPLYYPWSHSQMYIKTSIICTYHNPPLLPVLTFTLLHNFNPINFMPCLFKMHAFSECDLLNGSFGAIFNILN